MRFWNWDPKYATSLICTANLRIRLGEHWKCLELHSEALKQYFISGQGPTAPSQTANITSATLGGPKEEQPAPIETRPSLTDSGNQETAQPCSSPPRRVDIHDPVKEVTLPQNDNLSRPSYMTD
jgi:hypothetical protein